MLVHKTTFNCLGLTDRIVQTLKKQQYAFPTPIQEKAIPLLIERNDLLGIAQTGTGKTAAFSGTVTASSVTCGGVKCFNIPHPTKNNKRLVHACIEGPEAAVYIRGRLTDNNVIELPDYWKGLVDPETISVHLTQIGSSQDLMVDKIVWGRTIYIKSGTASMIDCYYTVSAVRIDIPALEIEQDA